MCLAVPGKITSITGSDPLSRIGKIDFGGITKEASLAYVPEATVGNYVIVHVGFALSVVDEQEAHKIFQYLREMEELADLEDHPAADLPIPNAPTTAHSPPPTVAPSDLPTFPPSNLPTFPRSNEVH